MKTTKILLSVLLTILLIVVGLATEILAIVNLTVIRPDFYKNTLRKLGFYDSIRTVIVYQIRGFVDEQEGIEDKYKDDAYQIIDKGLDKNMFTKSLGDFLGDTVNYIFYDKGNAEIPIHLWIESIEEEIKQSDLVKEVDGMEKVLDVTLTGYLKTFGMMFKDSNNVSDLIDIFTPSDKIRDNMDRTLWVLQYWIKWIHYAMYIGFAVIAILLSLLFLLSRKNKGIVFKIVGFLLIVNSISFILSGAFMFFSISMANVLGKIPPSFISHTEFLQSAINPIGVLNLVIGVIILAIGIGILILGGALTRKVYDELTAEKIDNLVSEHCDVNDDNSTVESNNTEEVIEDETTFEEDNN